MKSKLLKPGFLSLIATQFWGAANDNILKQVLTFMVIAGGVWADDLGNGGQGYVALCLTLPFIILSGFAGQVADKFSKRRVMLWVKIAELPIAIVAFIALYTENLVLGLASMVLLATQSTFFGPAKYGVIPELVDEGDLSRANGSLNMFTNIAIIMGIIIAGPVSDLYHPHTIDFSDNVPESVAAETSPSIENAGELAMEAGAEAANASASAGWSIADLLGLPADHTPMLWLPGTVMLIVAVLGLVSILLMPRLQPADPTLRFNKNILAPYIAALREMARGPLLIVAFAWSFFYLVGIIALLILPEYAGILKISYTQNIGLLVTLAISIGIGSAVCGLLSGHSIRPRFILIGAVGMSIMFVLLGSVRPTYWSTVIMLIPAGIAAGFYIVPLQALLQQLSPTNERGRFLGTANAMSFVFSSLGAIIFMICSGMMPSNRIFIVCGVLAIVGSAALLWPMRGLILDPKLRTMRPNDS